MKKILILVVGLLLTVTLTGCTKEVEVPVIEYVDRDKEVIVYVEEELPVIPAVVDMSTIDDFLGRPDVQYIDLRNFDDKMSAGYIAGFEMIPFFDYLEKTGILVRTDSNWDFAAEDILSQGALRALFSEDKTVFLMCGSGTRAGYVMAALESLGYTDVLNVGGIGSYTGSNLGAGDGSYNLEVQLPLPAVVDMTNIDMYLGRSDVQYVDLRDFDDKMNSGYIAGFEMIPFFDYLEKTNLLVRTDKNWDFAAEDIMSQGALRALFNEDKTVFLMCGSGTRAGYVMAALESLGYTNVINVGGIGSYTGANLVAGDGTYMNEVSVLGDYTPGTYFGFSDGLYTATVVIGQGGGITSVFFDAAYASVNGCSIEGVIDTEIDETAECDTAGGVLVYNPATTKQILGFDYHMAAYSASTLEWFEQANEMAAAIVVAQGWDADWAMAADGDHQKFVVTDQEVIDDVAGVTIGVEGFQTALEDALTQAMPAS